MPTGTFRMLALTLLLTAPAATQNQEDYLDLLVVKVRPEKGADFDALNRKVAEANRRHKGDAWLAFETTYGEQNTVTFISPRQNYAAIGQGLELFEKALKEA